MKNFALEFWEMKGLKCSHYPLKKKKKNQQRNIKEKKKVVVWAKGVVDRGHPYFCFSLEFCFSFF